MLILIPRTAGPVATGRLSQHTFCEVFWKCLCWALLQDWDGGHEEEKMWGHDKASWGRGGKFSLCPQSGLLSQGLSPLSCVGRNSGFCTPVESQRCPFLCILLYHRGLFLKEHCCFVWIVCFLSKRHLKGSSPPGFAQLTLLQGHPTEKYI